MTLATNNANPNNGFSYWAQFKVVAVDPITLKYLHMSGEGEP